LFPAVEGGLKPCRAALRKGHRDLPVFFDELNDALEAHNAEEYGRIALCGALARHDEKEEAELYRWRKRGEPAIKRPSKKYIL
jgi:hypothetical protein